MIPCSGCSRFIQPDVRRCPFCGTSIRDASSPARPALASVLLGLTLAACAGDDTTGDDGASASMSASASETNNTDTTAGTSGSTGPGMTSMTTADTGSSTTGPPDGEASVAAYGGPDVDTLPPDEETAESTMGDSDSTGTSGTTGTSSGG